MGTILLVEDEESLRKGIAIKLKKEGYSVFVAESILEAKNIFAAEEIDLIILDITLPDGNGLDFCTKIREKSDVFIIFLTALDQETDIVIGYDSGADDYVTKPFSLAVLISKVNAVFKRTSSRKADNIIISGDICIYLYEGKALKDRTELMLSKTELRLLKYLMENPFQIITKDRMLNEMWDIDGEFVDNNTLAVNVSRLRKKIGDDTAQPRYIKNVRGVGYIWSERCERR